MVIDDLVKSINQNCKSFITIPGTGTDKLLNQKFETKNYQAKDLKEAIKEAVKQAKKGDTILFSPGFASFGMFSNEYERNDLFVKVVKSLK